MLPASLASLDVSDRPLPVQRKLSLQDVYEHASQSPLFSVYQWADRGKALLPPTGSDKVLAAKAKAFDADPEVRGILAGNAFADDPLGCAAMLSARAGAGAPRIRALELDPDAIAARGHRYERLDQLAMEHLMGVRG